MNEAPFAGLRFVSTMQAQWKRGHFSNSLGNFNKTEMSASSIPTTQEKSRQIYRDRVNKIACSIQMQEFFRDMGCRELVHGLIRDT